MAKQIGIIGLGKMGMQIARRLHKKGYKVAAWNRSPAPRVSFVRFGGKTEDTVEALIQSLKRPRVVWTMLPSGQTNGQMQVKLLRLLSAGDIVIDGANENFRLTIDRAKKFSKKRITLFDAGTSGGVWGEKKGFSIMIGGPKIVWPKIKSIVIDLATDESYGLVGESGTGNFVKMVHNGIEYGMMEAIAEGFSVINKWNPKIDLAQVSKIWQNGSVVRSWLIDLCRDIFEKENLSKVIGFVKHTGKHP